MASAMYMYPRRFGGMPMESKISCMMFDSTRNKTGLVVYRLVFVFVFVFVYISVIVSESVSVYVSVYVGLIWGLFSLAAK